MSAKKYWVGLTVNGVLETYEVTADELLVDTLRDRCGYTSVKRGCDNGECGACTILMNGKAVPSCEVLTVEADGADILTLEGLSGEELDPIQQAFLNNGAIQCGFCTPGMVLTTKALLNENPHPSEAEIVEALQNNICRCTGYVNILKAVHSLID